MHLIQFVRHVISLLNIQVWLNLNHKQPLQFYSPFDWQQQPTVCFFFEMRCRCDRCRSYINSRLPIIFHPVKNALKRARSQQHTRWHKWARKNWDQETKRQTHWEKSAQILLNREMRRDTLNETAIRAISLHKLWKMKTKNGNENTPRNQPIKMTCTLNGGGERHRVFFVVVASNSSVFVCHLLLLFSS